MGFKPDYGLMLLRAGTLRTADLTFNDFHLFSLDLLAPGSYSTTVDRVYDGVRHALSLDFDHFQFEKILAKADRSGAARLIAQLSPYTSCGSTLERPVVFGVRARLGRLQTVEKEQFVPLIAQEIL
jgi:hypothetical protein